MRFLRNCCEIAVAKSRAVGGDQKVRAVEIRGVYGYELYLHWPGSAGSRLRALQQARRSVSFMDFACVPDSRRAGLNLEVRFAAFTAASSYAGLASRSSKRYRSVGQAAGQSPSPSQ
jgi:hypothetical protein